MFFSRKKVQYTCQNFIKIQFMDFSQKNVNFTFKFFLFFLLGIIFGGFWIFLGFKQGFFIVNSASQSENILQKNNFSQTSDNVKNS